MNEEIEKARKLLHERVDACMNEYMRQAKESPEDFKGVLMGDYFDWFIEFGWEDSAP